MLWATEAKGEGSSTTSNARHLMAVSLLRKHQIFMLALAKLRCVKSGGLDARCFPAPLWRSWCFFSVTGERPVPLPQLWVGEPLARRRREQGGGAFPRTQLRVK